VTEFLYDYPRVSALGFVRGSSCVLGTWSLAQNRDVHGRGGGAGRERSMD
jgi:hypothetical protein